MNDCFIIKYLNQERLGVADIQWAFLAIQMIVPLILCGIGGSIVLVIYNEP